MDGVNFFTRLRRLAIRVENESRIFEEKMQIPPKQRTVCGSTADNILKEMQFDAHKLKNEARKELECQQQSTSFKEVLAACENLLHVNQKQARSLKDYLVQYGYQAPNQQHTKPASLAKQSRTKTAEDKENVEMEACHFDNTYAASDQLKEPIKEPTTPEKEEITSNSKESITPKMEDFGLSMNRVNLFLKKGLQSSSSQPRALDYFNSSRMTPIESTVVYHNTELKSLEDSEVVDSDEGPHQQHFRSNILSKELPAQNYPTERAAVTPTCGTPESPNITSWFLQESSKPPVAPSVTLYQEETFTPPTPDCQTTQLVCTMPQEPRRLVNTIELVEPQEPLQFSSNVVNATPEVPACFADSLFTKQQAPEREMVTPPQIKKGPPHMSFLQQDATPKTPELTMSFSQLCKQPSLKASLPHHSSSSHQQESFSCVQPSVVSQTDAISERSPGFRVLAPITWEEFSTLSAKIRQNLSLDKVNEWMQIIDDHIARKPKEERFLSQGDLDVLQVYPWLRAALMLLAGGFSRLEKMEVPGFDDPIYMPL